MVTILANIPNLIRSNFSWNLHLRQPETVVCWNMPGAKIDWHKFLYDVVYGVNGV
jgi:hypothetical protein